MKQIPKKLSGFALKYIAMVSMLCDHANMLVIRRGFFAPFRGEDGSTLIPQNAPAWLGAVQGVYRVFDVLGHLAFPLCIIEASPTRAPGLAMTPEENITRSPMTQSPAIFVP